jgi:hypothetical protein
MHSAVADVSTPLRTFARPVLDFLDPWGSGVEIVSYDNLQFTERALTHLSKNEKAIEVRRLDSTKKKCGRRGGGTAPPTGVEGLKA